MSNLRQRYCVALTGFDTTLKETLVTYIRRLGGVYACDQGFRPNCTHVVCAKPTRSEKFLGACATGKWIVTAKWVMDSVRNGTWCDEATYEWSDVVPRPPGHTYSEGILAAPRRWRRTVTSSGLGAFSGWKASVAVSDQKKKVVYKRLLAYGGCKLIDLKVPFNSAEVVQSQVLYIFLDEGTRTHASTLFECGTLCLHPEYIGDFLVVSPSPDSMNYLIDCALTGSQRSIVSTQTTSLPSSQSSASTADLNFSQLPVMEESQSNKVTGRRSKRDTKKPALDEVDACSIKVPNKGKSGLTMRSSTNSRTLDSSQNTSSSQSSNDSLEKHVCLPVTTRSKNKTAAVSSSVTVSKTLKTTPLKQLTLFDSLSPQSKLSTHSRKSVISQDLSHKMVEKTLSIIGASINARDETKPQSAKTASLRKDLKKVHVVEQLPATRSRKKESSEPPLQSKTSQNSDVVVLDPVSSCSTAQTERVPLSTVQNFRTIKQELSVVTRSKTESTGTTPCNTPPHSRSASPCTPILDKSLSVKLVRLETQLTKNSPKESAVCEPSTINIGSPVPMSSSSCNYTEQKSHDRNVDPKIGAKRKLTDNIVMDVLQVVKRKKVSNGHWVPTQIFYPRSAEEESTEKGYLSSLPMSHAQCNIFESAVEECHMRSSLDIILSSLSASKYPTSRVIYHIIQLLLASDDLAVSEEAYSTLMSILQLHAPSSGVMRTVYIRSLLNPLLTEHPKGSEWEFLKCIMEKCLGSDDVLLVYGMDERDEKMDQAVDPLLVKHNAILVLKFVVAFLEQDYMSYMQRNDSKKHKGSLLLGNILWPGAVNSGVVNKAVRDLLNFLTEAISQSTRDDVSNQSDCTDLLQSLVFLAFECICLSEGNGMDSRFSFGPKTALFLHELKNRIIGEFGDQSDNLQKALKTMKCARMVMRVSQLALDMLDDSLTPEDEGSKLGLEKIVQHYFYLLPKLVGVTAMTTPKKKTTLPLSSVGLSQPSPGSSFNSPLSKANRSLSNYASPSVSPMKFGKNINKRNRKGETLLHVACIKNNVVRVRELLSVPGIDINIPDFAGWTSLHEACNHGHVECIKELFTFKPHRTITSYFGKETVAGIDLLAANEEGITPLHDAVLNDQKEAVRLLLQHGGPKLLQSKTILGFKPVDLAETDEIREILETKDFSSFESPYKKRLSSLSFLSSQSQDSILLSQTSNFSFNDSGLGPCDEAYDEVLGPVSSRKASTPTDCNKYVLFVYHLLQSYLDVYDIKNIYEHVLDADPKKANRNVEQSSVLELNLANDDNNNECLMEHSMSDYVDDSDDSVDILSKNDTAPVVRTRSGRIVQAKVFDDFVGQNPGVKEKKPKIVIKEVNLPTTQRETCMKSTEPTNTKSYPSSTGSRVNQKDLDSCQNNECLMEHSMSDYVDDSDDSVDILSKNDTAPVVRTRSGRIVQAKVFDDFVGQNPGVKEKKPKIVIKEVNLPTTQRETCMKSTEPTNTKSYPSSTGSRVNQKDLDSCQNDLVIFVDLDCHIKQFRHHLATISNQTIDDSYKMLLIQIDLLTHDYAD